MKKIVETEKIINGLIRARKQSFIQPSAFLWREIYATGLKNSAQ
jgi:hypothetical protein